MKRSVWSLVYVGWALSFAGCRPQRADSSIVWIEYDQHPQHTGAVYELDLRHGGILRGPHPLDDSPGLGIAASSAGDTFVTTGHQLWRLKSGLREPLRTQTFTGAGVAFDPGTNMLYWAEHIARGRILRARWNATTGTLEDEQAFATALSQPNAFAFGTTAGVKYLYWSTVGDLSGRLVQRQRLTSTGSDAAETVVQVAAGEGDGGNGVAFDSAHQTLYWIRRGHTDLYAAKLERLPIRDPGRAVSLHGEGDFIALTPDGARIYVGLHDVEDPDRDKRIVRVDVRAEAMLVSKPIVRDHRAHGLLIGVEVP